EAGLTLYGPFGSLGFGRFGGIASAAGTYDLIGYVDSFDGGDNNVWGFAASSRYDNVVAYQTPRFAGLQLTAQYSFKTDSTAKNDTPTGFSGDEGTSAAKRYASIGVSGDYGAAQFAAGYELTKYGANSAGTREVADKDGSLFFVGGNYNFEVVRVYAEAQYFEGLSSTKTAYEGFTAGSLLSDGLKGFGLHLGAKAPIAAGTLTAGLYYVDAKEDLTTQADQDFNYYGVSARYVYPLSKRTSVYGGAGYGQTTVDGAAGKPDQDTKLVQAYVGLSHTF
ncbi:porin, partial [Sutterella wadsworthensis]